MRVSFLVAPPVTVEFAEPDYDVTETDDTGTTDVKENQVEVTVTLSADPERTVTIPIVATGQDGATDADYSVPASVTFNAGETSKTFTFTAKEDDLDDDDESVKLEFGTMPDNYVTAGSTDETVVSITDDDDPAVTVQFGQAAYTVAESDDSQTTNVTENEVEVTVTLSADPERMITIPITSTGADGATGDDYSVAPASVTFDAGETSKTVTFTATHDTVDDDGERVKLGFGTMPDGRVTTGAIDEAIVSISDDDHPEVKVQFGQDTYLINEGQTVNVTITLDADPERTVEIPITSTNQEGASDADYDVPSKVTFNTGETMKTIAFMATDDMADDDDEEVKLTFGTMPDRVTAGTRTETLVKIVDDDLPEVTVAFSQSAYTVAEGETQVVTVTVSADPERTIIIPIDDTPQGTGTIADYSGVPGSVTFTDGGSTSQTFTFTATQDLIDDDGESVKLEFGTMPDERVSAGATDELTLTITDDDTAAVVLNPTSLTLEEEDAGHVYTVVLATEPTVNVTVNVGGHAGTDLTLTSVKLVNDELTFTPDNWNTPQAITLTAAHDDDGVPDSVTLTHTAAGSEYANVASDLPVTINDNDPLGIVLNPLSLELEESESADYAVSLATEPTQVVTVTISDDGDSDLDLSETTLTFTDADWNVPQTVTLTALHDEDRDDEAEVLAHTGAGGEYAGIAGDLPVTVYDNTGDLRLVEGTLTDGAGNPCEGHLEIYYDGQWGTICDDYWDKENADVACRALGFAGGSIEDGFSRKYRNLFPAGDDDQPIWLDDVKCTGGEAGLLGCSIRPVGRHNCRHAEDVGLRCIKSDGPFIVDMEFNEPPGNDGSYDVGDTVEVTVVWSEPVTVTTTSNGHPVLWLDYDDGVDNHRRAYYQEGGADSDRTVFTHTIEDFGNGTSFPLVKVDRDSLYVVAPGSLAPPGSIVSAQDGIPAILGHRAYRSDGHKAYATDGGEPAVIERVPAISDPGRDGVFGPGETVEISFVFNRPVEVDVTGGTPSVQFLLSGTTPRQAQFARGSGTLQLVFSYTLAGGDGTHRSVFVDPGSLALNGGTIRDTDNDLDAAIAHEGAVVFFLDAEAPTLQSATVDGSTLTLAYSETLDNTAILSAADFAVTVNGSPVSVLGAGAGQSNVILFVSPAVVAGDTVTVSYTAPTDANAAKIQDESRNPAASFSGQAVTNNTAAATNSPATGAPAITGTAQVGELLEADTSGIADSDGLTSVSYAYQWLADDVDIGNATGSSYTLTTAEQGKAIKVRVTFTDDAGNPEVLTSAATAAVAAAPEPETTPLTATVHNAATSHDGSAVFTFELHLSEAPKKPFSWRVLRDHAFTVTGGAVTKARRLDPDPESETFNLRWEITVTPHGNGPVTVVLPATTDCEADGAICTADGRMQSSRLEITVPGP